MDRRDAPPSLKHEVALLGEEQVVGPALQRECGADGLAPGARRISEASRKGLLRCAVCGTPVRHMFDSRNRWHFAVIPGGQGCDHEGETVAHREAKLALFGAAEVNRPWCPKSEEEAVPDHLDAPGLKSLNTHARMDFIGILALARAAGSPSEEAHPYGVFGA